MDFFMKLQFTNKTDQVGTLSYNENVLKVLYSEMYSLCNNIKVHSANIPRGYITRGLASIKALILTGWHGLLSSVWDKSLTTRHYNPQYILTFIEKCEIWPPGEVRMHTLDGWAGPKFAQWFILTGTCSFLSELRKQARMLLTMGVEKVVLLLRNS